MIGILGSIVLLPLALAGLLYGSVKFVGSLFGAMVDRLEAHLLGTG